MDITVMMEKRRALLLEMRKLHEEAKGEQRSLTAEEQSKYAALEVDVRELGEKIEAEKRERTLNGFEDHLPVSDEPENRERDTGMAEFRQYLTTGERRDLAIGANGGGVLAPQQFVAEIIKDVTKQTPLLSMVRSIPLSGTGSLGAPVEDADASDADWTDEVPGSEVADSTYRFAKREIETNTLCKLIKISKKLLATSAVSIDSIVREKLTEKISAACENAILNGTGTGQPLGLFKADNKGIGTDRDVVGENTQTEIRSDTFVESKMKVRAAHRPSSVWIMSTDVMLAALKLKDANGQYIWRPGLTAGEPDRLLNSPVIESEFAPAVMTSGAYVAVYGSLSHYWWAVVNTVEVEILKELYAAKNQIGYKGTLYADGAPVLSKAFCRVKMAA